jgi:quercetin dioxygenase-like cupin family protein
MNMKIAVDEPHVLSLTGLPELTNAAGMKQRLVSGRKEMIVWSDILAGTLTAAHAHENEQITWIIEGQVEITLAGVRHTCGPGNVVLVPGGVEHEVLYVTRSRIVEVFSGPRLDLFPAAAGNAVGAPA